MRPLIIAHRGASGHEPENTLSAFELAIELRADMIELDLHATRDGEVVVIHDDDLSMTTNLKGRVSTSNLAELRLADAGKGGQIPTLTETLDLARGRIQLYLELKNPGAARDTVRLVREFGMVSDVLIASFDLALMKWLKTENHDLKIGLILGTESIDPVIRFREHYPWIALKKFNYQILSLQLNLCRPRTILRARESGKMIFAWTANDEVAFRRLINLGVDGIVTNFPDRLAAILFGDSGSQLKN